MAATVTFVAQRTETFDEWIRRAADERNRMENQFMMTRLRTSLLCGTLMLAFAAVPMPAQQDKKMADKDKMSVKDKMPMISTEEKAAMCDRMSEKDQMSAMKMDGHDMGKMSSADRMSMMGKMTADDKAAAMDKMHAGKDSGMMKSSDGKMDKMEKADKMKK